MNPRVIYCTNYIDGCIYTAVFTAAKIKYKVLYKMAV